MIKLLKQFRPIYWFIIALLVVIIYGQVQFELGLADKMGDITALIQKHASTSEIWKVGKTMLLYTLGSVVLTVIVGFIAARLAADFSKRLRNKMFSKVSSFSMEEINGFSTSSLLTRTTNDIQQVTMGIVMTLRVAISSPIMAISAIGKIKSSSNELTLVTALGIILMITMITIIFIFSVKKFSKLQKLTDKLNGVTRENLTGLRVVRAYNAENYQEVKFDETNKELTKTNLVVNRLISIMSPGMSLIMNGLNLTVLWFGAYLINKGALTLPAMTTFTMYAMQVIMSFMMLTMIFIMLPRASVSAKRILEVLNTPLRIQDPQNPQNQTKIKGEIEFKNVSFRYPDGDGYVLKDISFSAKKGETIAIIGSTGSGKSSLINLIPRFFDTTEGEVLVDGINVKDYSQKVLRDKIGYVPQKAVLFSGTIQSNIGYGNDQIEMQEIKKAASISKSAEFIEKMEDQYDAYVSQGGKDFSGGQKQRLSIARAIAKQPEIYIFDDSFSALDYKTDKELRFALKNETSEATTILVAQRIGTILTADMILVLDQGKIVGKGTHKQLLKDCEVYRQIAYSQLSKEELADE